MSKNARIYELVEAQAESDARFGRPPEPRRAVQAAIIRGGEGGMTAVDAVPDLMFRYGLFYGATKAARQGEAADELVRRWRGL